MILSSETSMSKNASEAQEKEISKEEHYGTVRTFCTRRCNPFLGDTILLANKIIKATEISLR